MADEELPSQIMADDSGLTSTTNFLTTESPEADKSKRVILQPSNCIVILNGQKCQLKIHPDTGVLMAYPIKEDEPEASTSSAAATFVSADTDDSILSSEQKDYGLDAQTEEMLQESENILEAPPVVQEDSLVNDNDESQPLCILEEDIAHQYEQEAVVNLQQGDVVDFISQTVGEEVNSGAGSSTQHQTVLVDSTSDTQLTIVEGEATNLDTESGKEKLPVPELIIPSVGGQVTSLAITQDQVTGMTKIDSALIASNNDKEGVIEDVFCPELTITTNVKPALKQYLIPPSVSGTDGATIGIKTSGQDLKKLYCDECKFQAYYPQQYDTHLKVHHASQLHKCKCCAFVTLVEADLTSHYMELHPRNICELCNFVSEFGYVIRRHMYRHSAEGCTCEICGKTYKDQYILKMHIKMVHTPAEVLYQCDVCTKRFSRKAHLKRHARTHSTEKAYACPHCDYRGCERSDVTKHMLIHEAPKLVCEVCGKTFRHQKNKLLHMKRHKGQRDFKCGVCDFFGYTFTDIRKHIERRHTEWKNTSCGKCGASFKSHLALQEHILSWHHSVPVAASSSNASDEAVIFVDGLSQTSEANENTLIINSDGTVMPSEQEEQVIVSRASGEESVVEFTTSDMVVSEIGQDHFTIANVREAGDNQSASTSQDVVEIGDLPIDMCQ